MSTKITDHMLKGTSIRTLLQRVAAESGFNLVDGSFEEGAVVSESNAVVWFRNEGTYYGWGGTIPVGGYIVAAGSTPATAGGVGVGAWVDRTDIILRANLAATTGAGLVGTAGGVTVQDKLNAIDANAALKANTSDVNAALALKANISDILNFGRVWQDLTSSRAYGTTYYNTTGKLISVAIHASAAASSLNISYAFGYVDGVLVATTSTAEANGSTWVGNRKTFSFIVPPESSYSATRTNTTTLFGWAELR